jgi:hypothetical protein
MTASGALRFVERHGIVLESARHATIPSLAEAVAGEPIGGSWWSHPKGRTIFAATRSVRAAPQVLVCRLVEGKVSFVHARVWPALVRLRDRVPADRLARVREVHGTRGAHHVETVPFPRWVPEETSDAARHLTETEARATLAALIPELAESP